MFVGLPNSHIPVNSAAQRFQPELDPQQTRSPVKTDPEPHMGVLEWSNSFGASAEQLRKRMLLPDENMSLAVKKQHRAWLWPLHSTGSRGTQ